MTIEAGGLNSWGVVIGSVASGTSDVVVQTAGDRVAIGIVGTTVVAGAESSTTSGLYTFERSNTTAAAVAYFIL